MTCTACHRPAWKPSCSMQHGLTWLKWLASLQTAAGAEAKQADIRAKHLKAQLSEQQKALASNQKEARQLQAELDKQLAKAQECQQRCVFKACRDIIVYVRHGHSVAGNKDMNESCRLLSRSDQPQCTLASMSTKAACTSKNAMPIHSRSQLLPCK